MLPICSTWRFHRASFVCFCLPCCSHQGSGTALRPSRPTQQTMLLIRISLFPFFFCLFVHLLDLSCLFPLDFLEGPFLPLPSRISEGSSASCELSRSMEVINPFCNIICESCTLSTIAFLLFSMRAQMKSCVSFLEKLFYSLNDSFQSYLILLITDLLLGLQTPWGWEISPETIIQFWTPSCSFAFRDAIVKRLSFLP